MYCAKAVANFFLIEANRQGEKLSPIKLQKLVYYAHGWFSGRSGQPLIDETIQAWQYGPIIVSLYDQFEQFGSASIVGKASSFDAENIEIEVRVPQDPPLQQYLRNVWVSYGKFTATRLSEMTHAPGGPWDQTRRLNPGIQRVNIPFEVIRLHFEAAIQNSAKRVAEKEKFDSHRSIQRDRCTLSA